MDNHWEIMDTAETDETKQKQLEDTPQSDQSVRLPLHSSLPNTSLQEFLKQTTEIQEEIRQITQYCKGFSPGKPSPTLDWASLNTLLHTLGFDEVALLPNQEPQPQCVYDTLFKLAHTVAEHSAEQKKQINTVNKLAARNKAMAIELEKRKAEVTSEPSVESHDHTLREKLNRYKHQVRELKANELLLRRDLHRNALHARLNQELVQILNLDEATDLVKTVKMMTQVMLVLPKMQEMLQVIYEDFALNEKDIGKVSRWLKEMRRKSKEFDELTAAYGDLKENAEALNYFCKRFEIPKDQIKRSIDQIAHFVLNMKEFLGVSAR